MKGQEILAEFVSKAKSAHTHPAKLLILSDILRDIFKRELEEIIPGIETKVGSKILGVKGSVDLLFTNVIFEIKADLRREIKDAEEQLKKYFQSLYERDPNKKYIGIATDVITFRAYKPIIGGVEVIELEEISSVDISKVSDKEAILWLDSFIFSAPKILPNAEDLKIRFGSGSPTYAIVIDELGKLWGEVKACDDVKLKFELWSKNMEIVYGNKPELTAFLDHTYLITVIKLMIYLRLSEDEIIDENKIEKALNGEYFTSYGITNLIEEDFFTWVLHPKIIRETLDLAYKIGKELKYDFSQVNEDFFKEIYQEIVERGQRHRIGEYYTPEWLTEVTLKEALQLWENKELPKILDPACGSGTFLCNAIRRFKKRPLEKKQILDFILDNVVGVDVNPLAVIIAKANYLLALGDLLYLGKKITIPIYVADSIKVHKTTKTTQRTILGFIDVIEYRINGYHLWMPSDVAKDRIRLNKVIGGIKEAINSYRNEKNEDKSINLFKKKVSELNEDELKVLEKTIEEILRLIDKGLDSVWIFILGNIYVPVALSESKFDIIIGNPPWIAMRYIENREYQEFVKEEVFSYDLLDKGQAHLFTHMEVATLFFCKCADLYLKGRGIMAFVMPRSVLTMAFQHRKFKKFTKPLLKLITILDLENAEPIFKVPSCVLVGTKGEKTEYPVKAKRYIGGLPEKDIKLTEAEKYLKVSEYNYKPLEISLTKSLYHNKIKEGATLVPRSFWFVDLEPHPILGFDINEPYVKSSKEVLKNAKEPWKDLELEGKVEAEFIYATILGDGLLPFGFNLRPIVLPITPKIRNAYRLLDVNGLENNHFKLMADWLEKAQKHWEENRTERSISRFSSVLGRLNYNSLLSIQNPSKRFVMLYNTSGTNLASCVIDKQDLPEFKVMKAKIKPKGFIIESKTYSFETNNEKEAHYLCAIMNSNILNEAVKPLQTRGLFGERDFHRRPFMFPIKGFNENNELHIKLVELSKKCHAKVISMKFEKRRIGDRRKEARDATKDEIWEINEITSKLLAL